MSHEYAVRPMEQKDFDEVLLLMKTNFGEATMPARKEFWEWKHFKNPFGTSPAVVAEAQNKIVGVRVFMRWKWAAGEREYHACRAVDTATHPDWQRKGIFTRLTLQLLDQVKSEGASFIFNTPNQKSMPGYLKMGWVHVAKVALYIRVLKPIRFLRAGATMLPDENRFPAVEELLQQPALEKFIRADVSSPSVYRTARSIEYLRWRYTQIPDGAYRSVWDISGEDGAAAIFRMRMRNGRRELSISELWMTSDRAGIDAGVSLLKRIAAESGADYMLASDKPKTSIATALKKGSFHRLPWVGPDFTVRPLVSGQCPDPTSTENWRWSIGDLEVF